MISRLALKETSHIYWYPDRRVPERNERGRLVATCASSSHTDDRIELNDGILNDRKEHEIDTMRYHHWQSVGCSFDVLGDFSIENLTAVEVNGCPCGVKSPKSPTRPADI